MTKLKAGTEMALPSILAGPYCVYPSLRVKLRFSVMPGSFLKDQNPMTAKLTIVVMRVRPRLMTKVSHLNA